MTLAGRQAELGALGHLHLAGGSAISPFYRGGDRDSTAGGPSQRVPSPGLSQEVGFGESRELQPCSAAGLSAGGGPTRPRWPAPAVATETASRSLPAHALAHPPSPEGLLGGCKEPGGARGSRCPHVCPLGSGPLQLRVLLRQNSLPAAGGPAGRARGASFCPHLHPDLLQVPRVLALERHLQAPRPWPPAPSLASCAAPALPASGSAGPQSRAYLWSSCWASRTDRTASCRARSRLASFPHRGHGLSLPGMASSQCSAQGTRGHRMEGTGEAKMSKDVRGAGVWGPGVMPSSPAPQQGSPGAKMPSSSSDSSGQDSGVEPLLSVAWLWPEGWSLALRSRQSGLGPWREMAPLRPGAHPHHHVLGWPGRPADPRTPAGVPLALGTWRPAPFLKSRLAEEEAAGVWRTGSAGPGPGLALLTAGWAGQWASVSKPLPAAGAAWHTWWPAPVWLHGGHSCFPRHTGLPRCCVRSPCPLRPPVAPCGPLPSGPPSEAPTCVCARAGPLRLPEPGPGGSDSASSPV